MSKQEPKCRYFPYMAKEMKQQQCKHFFVNKQKWERGRLQNASKMHSAI